MSQPNPNNLIEDAYAFKLAIESLTTHIVITNVQGVILYANPGVSSTTGYSHEELLGKTPRLWGGQMDSEFYALFWKTIKEDRKTFKGEVKNRRKNGEDYVARATVSPIIINGELEGFIGIEEDISEHIHREHQLQEQADNLAFAKAKDDAIMANIGDGLIITDPQGIITFVNNQAEFVLGMKSADIIGKNYLDTLVLKDKTNNEVPREQRPFYRALSSLTQIKTNFIIEPYFLGTANNQAVPITINNTPVIIDNKLLYMVIMFKDVSEEYKIDLSKTEFVSLASHQLRTPLSTINWYTESLLNEKEGFTADQRTYLEEIYTASKRMSELVKALLNVSRLEMGTIWIETKPMTIKEAVEQVVQEQKIMIAKKNINVSVQIADSIPTIELDPKLMNVMLTNLVTNALKYTPPQGKVSIDADMRDGVIAISVADTGCGIPQHQQSEIFKKMFRADNARSIDSDGSGLGLYIIKSILDQSGGSISFVSEENKGTTFTISLPVKGMHSNKGTRQIE